MCGVQSVEPTHHTIELCRVHGEVHAGQQSAQPAELVIGELHSQAITVNGSSVDAAQLRTMHGRSVRIAHMPASASVHKKGAQAATQRSSNGHKTHAISSQDGNAASLTVYCTDLPVLLRQALPAVLSADPASAHTNGAHSSNIPHSITDAASHALHTLAQALLAGDPSSHVVASASNTKQPAPSSNARADSSTHAQAAPALRAACRAANATAFYAAALGCALMAAPHSVFGLVFDTAAASRGFVRLGGGLLALFGSYYWGAARAGGTLEGFFAATVWGRAALVALCAALYFCGEVGAGVWVLAAMNAAGAAAMWRALWHDAQARANS